MQLSDERCWTGLTVSAIFLRLPCQCPLHASDNCTTTGWRHKPPPCLEGIVKEQKTGTEFSFLWLLLAGVCASWPRLGVWGDPTWPPLMTMITPLSVTVRNTDKEEEEEKTHSCFTHIDSIWLWSVLIDVFSVLMLKVKKAARASSSQRVSSEEQNGHVALLPS